MAHPIQDLEPWPLDTIMTLITLSNKAEAEHYAQLSAELISSAEEVIKASEICLMGETELKVKHEVKHIEEI